MQEKLANANDPRAVRSREALHRAMLTLLESTPLDQITIRDIAAVSGVGYTTYFRHYPTKEALFEAIAEDVVQEIFNLSMPILASEDLQAASRALFKYVQEHSKVWTTLLTGGASGAIREQFLKSARAVARNMAADDGWMPPEMGVILIVSGTIEMLSWWLQQRRPLPIAQIAEIHIQVVVAPAIAATSAPPLKSQKLKVGSKRKR